MQRQQSPQQTRPRSVHTTIIVLVVAVVVLATALVATIGFQQGWFGAKETPSMGSPTTPASSTAASSETTPEDGDPAGEELAREVSRPTWRELNGNSQPVFVGTSEEEPVVDPYGPNIWIPDFQNYDIQRFDGERIVTLPDQLDIDRRGIYQLREGLAFGFATGCPEYCPLRYEVDSAAEPTIGPLRHESEHLALDGWLIDRRRVFEITVTQEQWRDFFDLEDDEIDWQFRVIQLDGTVLWQRSMTEMGIRNCHGARYQANGVSPWLKTKLHDCEAVINQNSGAPVSYGNAVVIATYDHHIVVYDRDREQFISYDADGKQERSFAVHAAALKMVSPYAARIGEGPYRDNEPSLLGHNTIVDYGLEVGYDDMVEGLSAMEAAGVAPVSDDGVLSTMKWEILPGGSVLELDMRTEGHSILSPLGGGVRWDLACANVKVIGGGTRALCQGGEDDGTLFQLNDDGSSTPLWKDPNGFGFAMKIFPFNHNQWVVYSDNKVWVFPN